MNIPASMLVFGALIVAVVGYILLSWAEKPTGVLDEATLILVGALAGLAVPKASSR
jgi:hypothetical protein